MFRIFDLFVTPLWPISFIDKQYDEISNTVQIYKKIITIKHFDYFISLLTEYNNKEITDTYVKEIFTGACFDTCILLHAGRGIDMGSCHDDFLM